MTDVPPDAAPTLSRAIVYRTHGSSHGPITRLISPDDLGAYLKPFVFLDLFTGNTRQRKQAMGLHPHSGIGTVTVLAEGDMSFNDPQAGRGTIGYGGVEWVRASGGIWHGKELSAGESDDTTGFQMWVALPPGMESGPGASQYVEAARMPKAGPAVVILGSHDDRLSPVEAPAGITYLLVTLKASERWTYTPPEEHQVAWLAVAVGALAGPLAAARGELLVFAHGNGPIALEGGPAGSTFVLGSAVPHPHDLHLGYYSVHTSAAALAAGEARIRELKQQIDRSGGGLASAGFFAGTAAET